MDPSSLARTLRKIASKIDSSRNPSRELVITDLVRLSSTLRKANANGEVESIEIRYKPGHSTEGNLIIDVKGSFYGVNFDIQEMKKMLYGAMQLSMNDACEQIAEEILSNIDLGYETDREERNLLAECVCEKLDKPEGRKMLESVNESIALQNKRYQEDRGLYG